MIVVGKMLKGVCSLTITTKQSSQNRLFIEVFGLSEKVGYLERFV